MKSEASATATAQVSVLHITESMGGGVASAIEQYVQSTPDISHSILRRIRGGADTGVAESRLFGRVLELPVSPLKSVSAIRRAVRDIQPSVIHCHSSWAGFFVRLAVSPRRFNVVYTPHCFAFERRDVGNVSRFLMRLAERLLARRATTVAGCSEYEMATARALGARRVMFIPNRSGLVNQRTKTLNQRPLVAGVGRLGPQKDPAFFAATVAALREAEADFDVVWIGGGSAESSKELSRVGVEVTGWITREETLERLAGADYYLHTAAWEGMPISLLEANSLGVACFVRIIPALGTMPASATGSSPEDLSSRLVNSMRDPALVAEQRLEWGSFLQRNDLPHQRLALLAAYEIDTPPGDIELKLERIES